MNSLMIETQLFMPWLHRRQVLANVLGLTTSNRFKSLGGILEKRTLNQISDLLDDSFSPRLVVNCSGLGLSLSSLAVHKGTAGAHRLVGDKEVYPGMEMILHRLRNCCSQRTSCESEGSLGEQVLC